LSYLEKLLFLQLTLAWRLGEACRNVLPIINHVAEGECWQDSLGELMKGE
jgi:hypothetical protein